MSKRSLYMCYNAKVKGDAIYCSKGHKLSNQTTKENTINIERLIRGEPLELTICQRCADHEYMGEPVTKEDRGWL